MRPNIYYWKCDCPRPSDERSVAFTAAKYQDADLAARLRRVCEQQLGATVADFAPLGGAGDHFAYRLRHDGRNLLLRAAVDATGDDYMLAETALCRQAGAVGVPVPEILHTEALAGAALRWQLMTLVPGDTLADLARDRRLDHTAVAHDLGRILRRLHGVRLDGFGFIDTERLRRDGGLCGIHRRYEDFFCCRLEEHLAYVVDHGLLTPAIADEVTALVAELLPRHAPQQASLVHRDPAWWNLIGTPRSITGLIDWDDAVAGDPADDLAMLRCFHDAEYCAAVEAAYWGDTTPDADFPERIALHWLRNMLWKATLRHQLGYFRPGAATFLQALCAEGSLEAKTRALLDQAVVAVRKAA